MKNKKSHSVLARALGVQDTPREPRACGVTPALLVDVNARDVFKREFVHARRHRLEGALIRIICTFRADFDAHRARARASLVSNVSADVPTRRTLARGSFGDDETWRVVDGSNARATPWTTSWINEYLFHDRAESDARERAQRAISTSNHHPFGPSTWAKEPVHSMNRLRGLTRLRSFTRSPGSSSTVER